MSKLITVIVPVHNAEKYLSCCLNSITAQSHRELEILLIDDGSTDGSAGECRKWCEKDGRCRFFHQENRGVSAARNRGLEEAGGEYVAFVDADDWILPGMLEKQLACLEQEDSDMVICGFHRTGEADRNAFLAELLVKKPEASCEGKEAGRREAESRKIHSGTSDDPVVPGCVTMDGKTYAEEYLSNGNNRCWSVLFSRKSLGAVRFREGLTIGEDLVFLVDLLPSLKRVSVMESREYCYYINEKGAMHSEFRPSYMDQLLCWRMAEEGLEKLFPSCLPGAERCLFQAALLVAGKLAVAGGASPDAGEGQTQRERYLRECHGAALDAWKRLGRAGRKKLPPGYRVKGPVFLHAPKAYLRLYHIWKGR